MAGGAPERGGLCHLEREGDEGAKNKRKRSEMTLCTQPNPNDGLKAAAAAALCLPNWVRTLQMSFTSATASIQPLIGGGGA